MKNLLIAVFFTLFTSLKVSAQYCPDIEAIKQTGFWIPGSGGSTSGLSASDAAKQKQVCDRIIESIKTKYTPKGMDVGYQGVFPNYSNLPANVNPGLHYFSRFYFYKHLYCPYKKQENPGTNSFLIVSMNDFELPFDYSFFVPSSSNEENPFTDAFDLLEQKPVLTYGVWHWTSGSEKTSYIDYFYLIAREDQVPFLYVTQKEFAECLREYYEKKLRKSESEYAEAIKSADEVYQSLKGMNEKEAANGRDNIKAQAESMREIGKRMTSNSLSLVKDILESTDANTLSQPARIDQFEGLDGFQGFKSDDSRTNRWVIKPNPAYFNPKLQKSIPQLITVHFKITQGENELIYKKAKEELFEAIDFDLLKSLLDK